MEKVDLKVDKFRDRLKDKNKRTIMIDMRN